MSRTKNLDFASYLLATKKMPFLRCEPVENGTRKDWVWFVFCGSEDELKSLEAAFLSGGQVSALDLLNSLRQLRPIMDAAKRKI